MALLTGYTGSSLNKFGRSITLALGDSAGVVATTISADATFDLTTATINAVNGGASNRNVTAVADVEVSGMVKVFKNTGTTNNLVIRSSAPATLATLTPGDWCVISYTGSAWTALVVGVGSLSPTAISLTDNSATALVIGEGANAYMTFDTANSSESVRIHKVLELLAGGIDMSQGAAGQVVYLKDNEAAALDISEGANVYLRCVTTNSGEQVVTGKPIHHAGGIAAASRFTSTEQTGTGSAQNVAHGLSSTPSMVWWSVSQDPAGTGFTVVPGAHDATNCVFTVTLGVKFYVLALK